MLTLVAFASMLALASARQQFIVGGSDSDISKFPWQGSWRSSTGSHSCGCVLVDANWILTAAHCVSSGHTAGFGATDNSQGGDMVFVEVSSTIVNPDYGTGPGFSPNDIAIGVPAITISVGTPVLVAPDANLPANPATCYISGWGRLDGGGVLPTTLQEVQIPVITDAECEALHGSSFDASNMICVYDSVNQDKGACNGDSGGPLTCGVDEGSPLLYGLTSWGRSGCLTTFPSVYNRPGAFRDWICANTANTVAC